MTADLPAAAAQAAKVLNRRGLLTGALAGTALATAVVKPAKADLSLSDLSEITELLERILQTGRDHLQLDRELWNWWRIIYRFARIHGPAYLWEILNYLVRTILDLAGQDGYTRVGRIDDALERSYPVAGVLPGAPRIEQMRITATATRSRVSRAMKTHAVICESLMDQDSSEHRVVNDAMAAESIPALLEGILRMQQAITRHQAQHSLQLQAIGELLTDQTMMRASDLEQNVHDIAGRLTTGGH